MKLSLNITPQLSKYLHTANTNFAVPNGLVTTRSPGASNKISAPFVILLDVLNESRVKQSKAVHMINIMTGITDLKHVIKTPVSFHRLSLAFANNSGGFLSEEGRSSVFVDIHAAEK